MSTYYYSCEKCGDELGSAQDILWLQEKPYHPECATERDRTAERDAAVVGLLEALKQAGKQWHQHNLNSTATQEQRSAFIDRITNWWNTTALQAIAKYVRLRDE